MQHIVRNGRYNLALLGEEIAAAAPELFDTTGPLPRARFSLSYDGTTLVGEFPDDFDVNKLQTVAQAHNPDGESINQAHTRRASELRQSIKDKFLALGFTKEELKYLKDVINGS